MRSKEGCERTVSILKKLGSRDKILKYAKWVFELEPQIGFKLFVNNTKDSNNDEFSNQSGINMTKDEVLTFLEDSQLAPDPKRKGVQDFSLKQKYLEWVTNSKNANEKYFTMLGEILIDNCFTLHPMSLTSAPKDKA